MQMATGTQCCLNGGGYKTIEMKKNKHNTLFPDFPGNPFGP